jgi:predicted RNA polymerase sigma factor
MGLPTLRTSRRTSDLSLSADRAWAVVASGRRAPQWYADAALPLSHRLPAVRAELLGRAGDVEGARAAYTLAIERCANDAERALLLGRREALGADR